jgi:hypothetical protein
LLNYDGKTKPTYDSAKDALAEVDVFIDMPVVLTPLQRAAGYKKFNNREVVFVLPDPPSSKYSLATARAAMSFTIDGM